MRAFHPISRIAAVLPPLLALMFARSLPAAVTGLICGLICLLLKKGLRAFFKSAAGCLSVAAAMALSDPLVSHRGMTVLLFVNGRAYTLEAMLYGLELGLSLGGVMVWLELLRSLVSERELLYIFGKISPRLAMTVSMTLGFMPRLLNKQRRISDAQKSAGLFADNSPTGRLESASAVFMACAAWSAETAAAAARSMNARGYGTHSVTYSEERPLCRADKAVLILQAASACAVTVFSAMGGDTVFFPALSHERYAVHLTAACAAACMPSLITLAKEIVQWTLYTSKT